VADNQNFPIEPSQLLTEQKAEMEALFTSIGDGAVSTDEFGKITRVNPKACQILGYSEAEMLGEWFPKQIVAVTPEDKIVNLIDRPITRAFLTGRTIDEKSLYRTKRGDLIPVSLVVSPILLDGKPLGAIEVFRDITVEEEVDRMKSEFISLASHQLRTPLSAIKTYSHMLVDGYMGNVTAAQKKSLRTIIGATNRMNELISTLLNITRMESGSIHVTNKYVRVDALANEVLQEVSLLAADRSISISVRLSGKGTMGVRTDPLILKEIITNLATNAIKYTPEKGTVTIKLQRRPANVTVSVADTGWGIPKSSQDQVFSKFFRAQNIVRRETSGTGLGLYLVKGLVDALGGKIWFNSEEGKGTTFFLMLPAVNPAGRAKNGQRS
jgi:PAS domain S-box-containing protein